VKKRWIAGNPLEEVEGFGKRNRGKDQLRIDEARKWLVKAVELAEAGEDGAVAAMMTLLLGIRCSEVVSRVVRDLDDDGRLLWIPDSKTQKGKRTLVVPDELRPYLKELAEGKEPHDLLLGYHDRAWPRAWVQRICDEAGVPMVTAHGQRGLHGTLSIEAGITPRAVADALGHESFQQTTARNYVQPEAMGQANQKRALTVLQGGKAREGGDAREAAKPREGGQRRRGGKSRREQVA
jgi:integrase